MALDWLCHLVQIICLMSNKGLSVVDPITDMFQNLQIVTVARDRLDCARRWDECGRCSRRVRKQ
jgi:hypothetical protein